MGSGSVPLRRMQPMQAQHIKNTGMLDFGTKLGECALKYGRATWLLFFPKNNRFRASTGKNTDYQMFSSQNPPPFVRIPPRFAPLGNKGEILMRNASDGVRLLLAAESHQTANSSAPLLARSADRHP